MHYYLYLESNCREPKRKEEEEEALSVAAIGSNLWRRKELSVDQIQEVKKLPSVAANAESIVSNLPRAGSSFSSSSSSSLGDEMDDLDSGVDDDCDGRGSKQSSFSVTEAAGFPLRRAHGEMAVVIAAAAGPEIGSEGRRKKKKRKRTTRNKSVTTIPHQALGEIESSSTRKKNNESISSVSSGMNVEKNKRDFRGYFFAAAEREERKRSVSLRPAFDFLRRKNSTFTSCETYKKYYFDGLGWWVSEPEERIPFAMRVSIARGIRRRQMAWNKRSRRSAGGVGVQRQRRPSQVQHRELTSLLDKTRAITLPKRKQQKRRRNKFYS